ncbi:MAG: hypothetical protein K0Q74_44 [Gammaproteobacteria bacterium]|nr:hypothetical protein [Gammaproteobacteria bacterium]
MAHLALSDLETALIKLTERYRVLEAENRILREQVMKLEHRRRFLMEKNDKAVVKVEHIISQLRDELNERIT